jgi:hypothetical protein
MQIQTPEAILGTKFVNDTNSLGVEFSRNHCKFPLRSTYDGSGDNTKPESWSCQPVSGSANSTDSNSNAAVPRDIRGNLLVLLVSMCLFAPLTRLLCSLVSL